MSGVLEQDRAGYALKTIKRQLQGKKENQEAYGRQVRRLPAMILNNGLGQALAFLLADAEGNQEKPSIQLYSDLQKWLVSSQGIYSGDDLIDAVMAGSRIKYVHAQQETLSLLNWMKRFADAYLPKSGGG